VGIRRKGVNRGRGRDVYRGREDWVIRMGIEVVEMKKPSPQHVGSTRVGSRQGARVWVSTTWTADHGWETMAFPCDAEGGVTDWGEVFCDRYGSRDAAIEGHAAAVAQLARGFEEGTEG
jgi:hypothetical protein